jgi:hypothetical protein
MATQKPWARKCQPTNYRAGNSHANTHGALAKRRGHIDSDRDIGSEEQWQLML